MTRIVPLSPDDGAWIKRGRVRVLAARLLASVPNSWWSPTDLLTLAEAKGRTHSRQAVHVALRDLFDRGLVREQVRADPPSRWNPCVYQWRGPHAAELEQALRADPAPRGRPPSRARRARLDAIERVVRDAGRPLAPREIAAEIYRLGIEAPMTMIYADLRALCQAGRLAPTRPARYTTTHTEETTDDHEAA